MYCIVYMHFVGVLKDIISIRKMHGKEGFKSRHKLIHHFFS